MRLLKLSQTGNVTFAEHLDGLTPPYAILSHTWGNEEVVFDDILNGRILYKAGLEKIRFCAEQAKRDGLEHFWVDTCCINKANLTELSESITSMFRWYSEAEKCYVYLSDVSSHKRDHHGHTQRAWEASFRASRWFTRGWTLQELLAPASVEFFSREGQLLGNKNSLVSLIQEITSIPVDALHGRLLSNFPVQERIKWAAMRSTTKPEDKAYCLLGIFGVFMAPIYGEGNNALIRLKDEIDKKHRCQSNTTELLSAQWSASNSSTAAHQPTVSVPRDASLSTRVEELRNFLGFEQMDSRQATIKSAYSTTCAWLLKTQAYTDWIEPERLEQHGGLLWIMGKPGAGKSTLIKFANAQAAKSPRNGEILASYFFNARGNALEKSTLGMYRSLLFQLLGKAKDLQQVFDHVPTHMFRAPQFQWTAEQLRELLTSAVQSLGSWRLRCFIDALDECDEQEVRDMILHFEELWQISNGRFHVCFASRHYPTIEIRIGIRLVLEDELGHGEDLTKYIQSHLRIGKGRSLSEVKTQVQIKANGVFMWAVLVIDILNEEFRRGRIPAVQKKLDEIPAKLSDLFKDILRRDCTNMDDLLLCIQWLLFARRPLERAEFYFAMLAGSSWGSDAVTEWDPELISEDDMKRFVLDCSKGLAELTRSSKSSSSGKPGRGSTVQFIHESVRDFLIKDGGLYDLWPELQADPASLSHRQLTNCCQRYLSADMTGHIPSAAAQPPTSSDDRAELRKTLDRKFPFITYAAEHVLYHANEAAKGADKYDFLIEFNLQKWISVKNQVEQHKIRHYTEKVSLLYLFAEQNLDQLIKNYYKLDLPVPQMSRERYRCPFSVALAGKNWDALQALLEPCNDPCTPEVLETLKTRQNTTIKESSKAYLWALRNGHRRFAEMLTVFPYTDITVTRREGQAALFGAAQNGCVEGVRNLASYMDEISVNALQAASAGGHQEVVKLLFEAGADVNAWGGIALHAASKNGHQEVVKLLLESGVDVNARGSIALWAASEEGHQEVVKLLLESGPDVNAQGGIALWAASGEGHQEVVKLLLEAGADVNAQGCWYGNALPAASEKGFQEVVKLLLEAGADINAQGGNALLAASERGRYGVVKLLLEAGADVNAQGGHFSNSLQAASNQGHQEVVKLLLEAGADVNAQGGRFGNALQAALNQGDQEVVKLLRSAGAQDQ